MIVRTRVVQIVPHTVHVAAVHGKTNGERILAVMELNVWYQPRDIVAKTGICKSAAYLVRLAKRGLVRKKATSLTSDRNFIYRRVAY